MGRALAALRDRLAARRQGLLKAGRVAAVVLAGLGGGWLGLVVGGQVLTPVGPADVSLSVGPSWDGETVVDVAPLGTLAFDTHSAPLRFEASIDEIRLAAAEEMFENPEAIDRMGRTIVGEVKAGVIRLMAQSAAAAALGAGLVGLALFRSWRRAGLSAATALAAFAAAGGAAAATFNPSAIAEPRYSGLLAGAPQVVGSAEAVVSRFDQYREQLASLVGNVSRLYEVTSTLPVYEGDESTVRVLHVSDIHLNPASWNVISSIQEQFQVDLIVDSGDLTDRGSAAEDAFADEIADLEVPYVWVRGNHDSMGTQRAVEAQPNAVVLDGRAEEVGGIVFYGAGDPRFTPDKTAANPGAEELRRIGEGQAAEAAAEEPPVDVAVLHDPAQAEGFDGRVPLVLSGHGHRRWTELTESGTRYLVQGSTGGAGLRGLEGGVDRPKPYEASVLYIDTETKRLQAWDDITLGGLGLTSAQIERHIEEEPDRELVPPSPTPSPPVGPTPSATPSREADSPAGTP
ncbi:metallophosphoesterase [Nocardiopsis sp. LSu2-4]|uniref:Metallophosphoesterase n=1 Tax=Nocardiopsis suaedae TaxID=3018444 RepID=A0ABT4TFK0_9ACTN|nr:metallophosphoesterase [Nocardiopsis suaedae]MDA2803459.1 metallophosphoesterase [Nocardiopsis suaedae]